MNEPTVTRGVGNEVAWTGWQAAADRGDRTETPQPDVVRSRTAPVERVPVPPAHVLGDGQSEPEGVSSVMETSSATNVPQSYARFSINEKTHRISIKIVDAATDEVLREIPSEEVQRIAEELQALARKTSLGRRPQSSDWAASGGIDRYV